MRLRTRDVVISGLLGGISIFLGMTGWGFIPMPTGVQATIMHLPVIIGAVLEGPVVGTLVGFIFGFFSWAMPRGVAFFVDPLVSILPRLFIGIVSYWVFKNVARLNTHVAIVLSGIIGSLTNTVLVLSMVALRGYLPVNVVKVIAVTNGLPEAIVSGVLVYMICIGVKKARDEF